MITLTPSHITCVRRKEPTHCSRRVGDVVPGISLFLFWGNLWNVLVILKVNNVKCTAARCSIKAVWQSSPQRTNCTLVLKDPRGVIVPPSLPFPVPYLLRTTYYADTLCLNHFFAQERLEKASCWNDCINYKFKRIFWNDSSSKLSNLLVLVKSAIKSWKILLRFVKFWMSIWCFWLKLSKITQ